MKVLNKRHKYKVGDAVVRPGVGFYSIIGFQGTGVIKHLQGSRDYIVDINGYDVWYAERELALIEDPLDIFKELIK